MLSRWGGRWHTLREWGSPGEWMPRLLRIHRAPSTPFLPGVLIVELAGWDRARWEEARGLGAFPFVDSLCARQGHSVHDYHAGSAWSRAAREAELLHGASGAFAGDLSLEARSRRVLDLNDPRIAASASAPLPDPLLAGGASWGALLPGGADESEFHPESRVIAGWAARLRERLGTALDLRRGLPAIYTRLACEPFGSASAAALRSWRRLDHQLARLYHRARRARRRDYETWLLFTPEDRGRGFPGDYARAIETALGDAWTSLGLRALVRGPVAHVYARHPLFDADKGSVAVRLLRAGGAGAVLWKDSAGRIHGRDALRAHAGEEPSADARRLADWLPYLSESEALALASHADAGDWVLLRGDPEGGRRPCETAAGGVAVLPPRTRTGRSPGDWLRADDLHRAARHVLERGPLPFTRPPSAATAATMRLVTYNVHRCIGMDGRQSVRRVLRVLADLDADFIALQEVSAAGANQAGRLAAELGMEWIFCPTLTGDLAYGHALLCRHPFTVKRLGLLPLTREASWKEPRGVIHAEVRARGAAFNLFSTHLALGRADRSLQVDTLLGPGWIGGVPHNEPVLLCGDFNFPPGGRNHRRITARLADAQLAPGLGAPLKTFCTLYTVARLDHVFVSPHFAVERIHVPRTHLTGVASDHFPLIVDLSLAPGRRA